MTGREGTVWGGASKRPETQHRMWQLHGTTSRIDIEVFKDSTFPRPVLVTIFDRGEGTFRTLNLSSADLAWMHLVCVEGGTRRHVRQVDKAQIEMRGVHITFSIGFSHVSVRARFDELEPLLLKAIKHL